MRDKNLIQDADQAWLGLGKVSNLKTDNILCKVPHNNELVSAEELVKIISRPEYIHFFCKEILNINILPLQNVILQELFIRKFPMYIGTRGQGKAMPLNTPILTDKGWINNIDISIGTKIYGRDGELHNVTGIFPQGKKRVWNIRFLDGREIECCEDHLWLVKNTWGKEVVISTKKMYENGVISIGPSKKQAYKYRVPINEGIELTKNILPIDPYILGCLLGDGCMTTLTPKIASDDEFIVDEFIKKLPDFEVKRDFTNNSYTIVDLDTKCENCSCGKKHRNSLTAKLCQMKINVGCKQKYIPEDYKNSSIEDRMEIVRGLLDTDGSINKYGSIEFTNTCEKLVDDLMDILRSLGISCTKSEDHREGEYMDLPGGRSGVRKKYFRVYINTSKPVFKLPRKLERLKKDKTNRESYNSIISIEPSDKYVDMQCISVDSPDNTYITKDYIVTHNSFSLAILSLLKCLLVPGSKVVLTGGGFRQAKLIFEYIEQIWNKAPVLRDICSDTSGTIKEMDRWKFKINDSLITAIPLGNGLSIRGLRSSLTIADEFRSISPQIFEEVVQGFGSVKTSPMDSVILAGKRKFLKEEGVWSEESERVFESDIGNQTVISGTAGYDFEHFAAYWKRWHSIIEGDRSQIAALVGEENSDAFDNRDFSIIRVPYELIPEGFMDEKGIAKSKATIHSGIFLMEYGAVFVKDSEGFFKRTLIESCVCNPANNVSTRDHKNIVYNCSIYGDKSKKYIMGIDPASEKDNLAIVILELYDDHWRVIYTWTTNAKEHAAQLEAGRTTQENYYSYCCRKVRDLMKVFPISKIGIDGQGGGKAIMEGLHDKALLEDGEDLLWQVINPDKESPTDDKPGSHIIEKVEFGNAEWNSQANHGLRKDLEMKFCLFPQYDALSLSLAVIQDKEVTNVGGVYDKLESCIAEIEELKNELCTIIYTQTGISGRDRWDTPEIKQGVGKKGRVRKDRYSALVIANMIARSINRADPAIIYATIGGMVKDLAKNKDLPKATGESSWYRMDANICMGVSRKRK